MAKKGTYNVDSITTLDPRTHFIKRMNLTFGAETGDKENPFSSQKTVAIRELTDNAVDEIIGGYASRVRVIFTEDGAVEVQDNGRGLPVDIGKDGNGNDASGLYLTLGIMQSGGKLQVDDGSFSAGTNGLGASASQMSSIRADIISYRDGYKHYLQFKQGVPGFFDGDNGPKDKFTPIKDLATIKKVKDPRPAAVKKLFPTGTTVKLWLDQSVYASKLPVNRKDLTDRLRGTAFLLKNAHIEVINEVDKIEDEKGNLVPQVDTFYFAGGLPELVSLSQTKDKLINPALFEIEAKYTENAGVLQSDNKTVVYQDVQRTAPIEVSFSWDNGYDYHIESYVNTIRTRLGGVHETAFEKALTAAFSDKLYATRGLVPKDVEKLLFEDFKEGLTAVIHVKISEPQFTGQAKEELGGKEVQKAMLKAMNDAFAQWVSSAKNAKEMKTIGEKVVNAAKARVAQKDAKEMKRKLNKIEGSNNLPEKLADCNTTHSPESEIYIAEGDSAKTALMVARDSENQAILPVRGKPVNAYKTSLKTVLANKEVQDIIQCLGAGIGDDFDISKVRYHNIFIATDADPDGGAIAALILVLIWRIARPMIEQGRVYQICTPLFSISVKGKGEKRHYAQNEEERDKIVKKLEASGKRFTINRIKGLGECPKDVMIETGMDPVTRTVKQIVLEDVEKAIEMFDTTLGTDVAPRKLWIEANPMTNINELS